MYSSQTAFVTILYALGRVTLSSTEVKIFKHFNGNGSLTRTIIVHRKTIDWDQFDSSYTLISDSNSKPISTLDLSKPVTVKKDIVIGRRRRKKKNPTKISDEPKRNSTSYKDPKFLNLFTIIKFSNEECVDGGKCYHSSECDAMGGVASSSCANGFGVCCLFEVECGVSGQMNGEIFVGGTMAGVCSLNVEKKECTRQMRFDFLQLEMEDPVDGSCVSERLLISGQNTNSIAPTICGSNTGQHMYVDVDETKGPVTVTVISPERKKFRIMVRQLCEGDYLMAPRNCLQYYTKSSGIIQSFNYRRDQDQPASYMNDMNYAICIRKAPGMCTITYSNIDSLGEEFPFEMNNMDFDGALTVPPREAGAEVFNCPDDYIVVANVRLCGQKLNDATVELDYTKSYPITDTSGGPFHVQVVSDSAVTGRGFMMNYRQKDC